MFLPGYSGSTFLLGGAGEVCCLYDGEFYAISSTPKKLSEWAKEVKKARQLSLPEGMIGAKLKTFANAKRDTQIMKKHNTGLPVDTYKCMFVGVWNGDYSLYLNVTDKFHLMLNQTVQTTRSEVQVIPRSMLGIKISNIAERASAFSSIGRSNCYKGNQNYDCGSSLDASCENSW
ncbi:MAG: hypothetical protein ACRCVN_06120 [Spirochaetia bacterium]